MNTVPEDEDIIVRVAVAFDAMQEGETFTISSEDKRMKSLLGAGYLQQVERPVDAGEDDGQQIIEIPLPELVEEPRGKGRAK